MAVKLSKLEKLILGRLVTQPMSGYGLHKWLVKEGPFFGYSPQPSQIYRQLAKTLDKGWLELAVDTDTAGPDAKIYSLSESGLKAFREWAYSPHVPSERPLDADFQMRMLLTGVLGPELTLEILRVELEYRKQQELESKSYENAADLTLSALPLDAQWHHDLVQAVSERSFFLGRTNLSWLEITYNRLSADIALGRFKK